MLENDQAGGLGSAKPLIEVGIDDLLRRAACRTQTPIGCAMIATFSQSFSYKESASSLLAVPDYRSQAKHNRCNSVYARIGISVGRTPVSSKATSRGDVDELHRPAKLGHDFSIR